MRPCQRTIFDDLPLKRRLLAKAAIGSARLIQRVSRQKHGGTGTLLVAYANLGDQLRMMNVLSRFLRPGESLDIACNAGTDQVFRMYPLAAAIEAFGAQGAGALRPALAQAFIAEARYEVALVPHPFMTEQIAIAYGQAQAQSVRAVDERTLSRDSWRLAYERFFESTLEHNAYTDKPQLRRELMWSGEPSFPPTVVVHLAKTASSRALDAQQCAAIIATLQQAQARIVALGSSAERPQLERIFADSGAEMWCGKPLAEVAQLLARSSLFVGPDSSMMNLADAVGTPSVIIYLTTSPNVAGPFYSRSIAVTPERYEPVGVQTLTSWSAEEKRPLVAPSAIANAIGEELRRS